MWKFCAYQLHSRRFRRTPCKKATSSRTSVCCNLSQPSNRITSLLLIFYLFTYCYEISKHVGWTLKNPCNNLKTERAHTALQPFEFAWYFTSDLSWEAEGREIILPILILIPNVKWWRNVKHVNNHQKTNKTGCFHRDEMQVIIAFPKPNFMPKGVFKRVLQ